jgi:hypothetical protein
MALQRLFDTDSEIARLTTYRTQVVRDVLRSSDILEVLKQWKDTGPDNQYIIPDTIISLVRSTLPGAPTPTASLIGPDLIQILSKVFPDVSNWPDTRLGLKNQGDDRVCGTLGEAYLLDHKYGAWDLFAGTLPACSSGSFMATMDMRGYSLSKISHTSGHHWTATYSFGPDPDSVLIARARPRQCPGCIVYAVVQRCDW